MKNNNIELISNINSLLLQKKFEVFYSKYTWKLSSENMKEVFHKEFWIKGDFSTEYILFLEYLIIK